MFAESLTTTRRTATAQTKGNQMQVEGVKYNGLQMGFGVFLDQLVFTDLVTKSTFYVATGASADWVKYIRDLHRAEWKRQEEEHAAR
jgi:hypothetical protein